MSDPGVATNPWQALRALTDARIALGRAGVSVPTDAQLAFQLAHARARDAVHHPLDAEALAAQLGSDGWSTLHVHSACPDRATYLQRPDLGRRLDDAARSQLTPGAYDLALVVADGLSAPAVATNALPLLATMRAGLAQDGWTCAPIVIAQQGRVALGDEIGALLGVRAVVVLIGERPGLSSPHSMGIYLTWAPQPGLADAARNCISNVRPAGLSYVHAAKRLRYLLAEARRRGLSGIALKDETDAPDSLGTPTRSFLLE